MKLENFIYKTMLIKRKKIEIENFQTVYVYFYFLSFIQVFRTNINIYH